MAQLTLPRFKGDPSRWIQDFLREIESWVPSVLTRSGADVSRIFSATTGVAREELGLIMAHRRVTTFENVTGATLTITDGIEQGWLVWGVFTRNITAVGGATSYDVGDSSPDVDRWGAAVGVDKNDKNNTGDFTVLGLQYESATLDVVLTANGGNFNGGTIEVVRVYSPFDF